MRWVFALLCLALLVWLLIFDEGDRVQPVTAPDDPAPRAPQPGLLGAQALRDGTADATPSGASSADRAAGAPDDAADIPRISLRVDTVEGLTGRALVAAWNLGTGHITGGPFPPGEITDEARERQRKGVRAAIAQWRSEFRFTGAVRPEALDPEDPGAALTVRLPPGYVLDDPEPRVRGEIAAGVHTATCVVPLWREAVLDVRVLDPEGQPARHVEVLRFAAAGRLRPVVPVVRAPGELRISGLPHYPGEPVRAVLGWGWGDAEPDEIVEEEIDEGPSLQDAHLVATMPDDLTQPWHVEVRLKSKRGPRILDSVEVDNDVEFVPALPLDFDPSEQPPASVRVRVLGHDGRPVRGASVGEQQTDAAGRALLTDLPPGPRVLVAHALGRFSAWGEVELISGKTVDATLREPVGARLEVLVTDGEGGPRPSAHVKVVGRKVFDVGPDGVQRLDAYTAANGRRSFARVASGKAMLIATWGSRTGARSVTLQDGETKRVTIVVR